MLTAAARYGFAAVLVTLGVVGVWRGDFVPPWEPVSADAPARDALVVASAGVSFVCGAGLAIPSTSRLAARVLLGALALWFAAFRVRAVIGSPSAFDSWDGCAELAVTLAAALALSFDAQAARFARSLVGVSLACFGIGHFAYPDQTAALVPAYFPEPELIAWGTGVTFFLAAALALTGIAARRALWLAAAQIAGFTLLVWVPIVAAGGAVAFQWSELGLSALLALATAVVASSSPPS